MTENGETKINETLKLRAEACLDSVPEQLSREYKKFKYSEVDVKGHSTEFVLTHPSRFGSHPAVKYADTNVGGGDGFSTYPLYALGFLENESDDSFVVPEVDIGNLADIISDRKNK